MTFHKSVLGRGIVSDNAKSLADVVDRIRAQEPLERPVVDHLEELKGWVRGQMFNPLYALPDGPNGWNLACNSFLEKLDSLSEKT